MLIWSADGEERRFIVSGLPLFAGRLMMEDASRLGLDDPDYLGVYIYSAEGGGTAYHTGVRSASVSRRHAKLVREVEGREPGLYVIDHGPRGAGSRNGTFVNGKRVLPGRAARLREGDTLKLSPFGPTFVVGYESRGVTKIRARAGIPVEVPKSLARDLASAGALADYVESGASAVVVIKAGRAISLGDKKVLIEEPSEVVRRIEIISSMKEILLTGINHIAESRLTEAIAEFHKLTLKPYREMIEGVGEEKITSTYRELMWLIRDEAPDSASLKSLAKKLLSMLRAIKY